MTLKATIPALLAGVLLLGACDEDATPAAEKKVIGVIDETDLNDIMLTIADPNEAVSYFKNASAEDPKRIDLKRGLAQSLIRAKRIQEGVIAYEDLAQHKDATNQDRVEYADALIRDQKWEEAANVLNTVPPTHETYLRYRLEAMVADSQQKWDKSDSFYQTAAGLTTQPANVMNNWGYSKLTRGDHRGAERLFVEAITYDSSLFTAKNNLILARAAQRNYQMPVIPLTADEKGQLLYTMGLSAVKQGDEDVAVGLFQEAIETSPRHFPEAQQALAALQTGVVVR